ncbi:glucose/mannose transport system substrate-binding protein [Collimonas sp. OK607]|uniref:ABC transporter substrate-binding protein n=1 Tax=Collimonas sp. OK607 TaxID=1798194 RepID=UPI0008F3BBE4|nr:ABC transporter substrate-binding protein [Collimonas sp. OK607]SFA74829.1 glucose/mannose transport system substrate-binding protein [Collimonas sp. OK607]
MIDKRHANDRGGAKIRATRSRSSIVLLAALLAVLHLFKYTIGTAAAATIAPVAVGNQPAAALQVVHWWTSAGERKAVDVLSRKLAEENIQWRDLAIPGGAGLGASKVLKSMVLAGKAPEATQLNGIVFGEWADLGLLLELDDVATPGNWQKLLFPTVWSLVHNRGHVVAVPLGIHRINNLFYNKKIFDRLGLAVPKTWAEFDRVADKLKHAGITPLAQSSEAWQVATLFETLVLAESGPAYYRSLFVDLSPGAFGDARMTHALKRLRVLKEWMPAPLKERPWPDMTRQLADGDAAMFVMGDWAKGELLAWGLTTDRDFSCVAVPGTADYHLYSVDTLAMFAGDYSHQPAQEKLAQLIMSQPVQTAYNQVKGAIPVWRSPDLSKMDSCARASWNAFSKGSAFQAPSLVHRMAADETAKDAIVAEVHRYFMDDKMPESDIQRRLAGIARSLSKTGKQE